MIYAPVIRFRRDVCRVFQRTQPGMVIEIEGRPDADIASAVGAIQVKV
jgi:hypothetical protein